MNQWGHEQFNMMPSMVAPVMGQSSLLNNAVPQGPPGPGGMASPLVPPMCLMNEWNQNNPDQSMLFLGAKNPNNVDLMNEVGIKDDMRDTRRDMGDRDKGEKGRRPRSPFNRNRNDRSRSDRRDRRPRWSDNNDSAQASVSMGNNMMMTGNSMMSYGNMMGQQPMDMGNMSNITHIPNMLTSMTIMPNMMSNIMPNMMDHNMVMMQQQMMSHQPIYLTVGVLLPPLPNIATPSRRDQPPGCRTIFIGGLPNGITENIITEIFQRFGQIDDIKKHKQGGCYIRFQNPESVEQSFMISGYRLKHHDQSEHEATTIFIDYALNRDDQMDFERSKRKRSPTPPRIEPYTPAAFSALMEKIKSDNEFSEAAPTLTGWLERGECNKKNANAFYSLIQASNNQVRRLYTEKMAIDEEFTSIKNSLKDKFAQIIMQFEQVSKILMAAKLQRVSDHFSKQQRRNIEMWLKMTEDVDNIKDEFSAMFDEEDGEDKAGKNSVSMKKYEELKTKMKNLHYELEGYKNEAHLAKDEAERKFEKFKAHFIAQQALQNNQTGKTVFPTLSQTSATKPDHPLPVSETQDKAVSAPVAPSDAKLISILTAFLLVHPLGASLDYLVSYVRSIIPTSTQAMVHTILQKYSDVFSRQTTGVGANIENRWTFVTFEVIKQEAK